MTDYDVIITGSGIAGLTTALLLPARLRVALLTKGELTAGSTTLAQGGIAAVADGGDSIALHVKDTLEAGAHHNEKRAVQVLSQESRAAIRWLADLGVAFDRQTDGSLALTLEAAHSIPRTVHASDFTGRAIEQVLVEHTLTRKNIKIMEHHFCVDLVVTGGVCAGVTYLPPKRDKQNECLKFLQAQSVILATGGVGQLYEWTTNPAVSTGDGVAMAKRAGAALRDMEFIQFHPTAFKHGESPLFLLSEALRGEGARLVDAQGARFLHKKVQGGELGSRDRVSRAIFNRQKKSDVYLDMRHKSPKYVKSRFSNIYHGLKKRGYDLTRDRIPVTPAAHYLCGGIAVDLWGQSTIKNLYAVGEVACTGAQGANRLASNSLLEGVVFGRRVAGHIAKHMTDRMPFPKPSHKRPVIDGTSIPTVSRKDLRMIETKIKKIMWDHVGIIRTEQSLQNAQMKLVALSDKLKSAPSKRPKSKMNVSLARKFFEVQNILQTAQAITEAALTRKKSLGTHYVVD